VLVLYFLVGQPRWLRLAAGLVAFTLVLWLPWFDPSQPAALLASFSAGGERYVNALVDLPTPWLASHLVDRAGENLPAAEAAIRFWPRSILRGLFVAYVAWEAFRVHTAATLPLDAAVRTVLVLLLLVVTQVLAWYFVWPVVLAAALGWRSTLARIAVAYSVLYLPVFYAIHEDLVPTTAPWLIGYAVLPVLAFRVSRWRGPPKDPNAGAPAAPSARGTPP
jgi:hypothetical protein